MAGCSANMTAAHAGNLLHANANIGLPEIAIPIDVNLGAYAAMMEFEMSI